MNDPISNLIDTAIYYEIQEPRNPYLTFETIVHRLLQKISDRTRVPIPSPAADVKYFSEWHEEILRAYERHRAEMPFDERICVERVLSKDHPHPVAELAKFACCWYKRDPETCCRWFAVDGFLGNHPKQYVHDAFSTRLNIHNRAVRALYDFYVDADTIHLIVERAFAGDGSSSRNGSIENCVAMYVQMVGTEEMARVAELRKRQQMTADRNKKRKRKQGEKKQEEEATKQEDEEVTKQEEEATKPEKEASKPEEQASKPEEEASKQEGEKKRKHGEKRRKHSEKKRKQGEEEDEKGKQSSDKDAVEYLKNDYFL